MVVKQRVLIEMTAVMTTMHSPMMLAAVELAERRCSPKFTATIVTMNHPSTLIVFIDI